MKSIKTNPNSAKGPDKGKIVSKLYCILLITLELSWTRRRQQPSFWRDVAVSDSFSRDRDNCCRRW